MRPMSWMIVASFALSVTTLGCNQREMGEPAEPMEEPVAEELDRDVYVRAIDEDLDALQRRLEMARRNAAQEGRELDAETDRQLQEMENDLAQLKRDLETAGEQAEADWKEFTQDVDQRTDRLQEQLRSLDLDVDVDLDADNP